MLEERIIPLNTSGGSSNSFVDIDGNSVSASTVKDDLGNNVLRVVDSAPFAYDENHDALKTMVIQELPRFEFIGLAPQFGVNIANGTEHVFVIESEVLSKYNKIRVGIVNDSSHSFSVNGQWRSERSVLSSVIAVEEGLIDETTQRGTFLISDFITDRLELKINNKDSVAHTYDIHVFGVRG